MSCNTVLASIKLGADDAVLAEGTSNSLTDRTDGTVRIELLADCTGGGDYAGVLLWC